MTSRAALVAAVLVVVVVLPGVTLALAMVAALGGAVAGGGCGGDGGVGGGSQQIAGRLWSAEQTANAHTIIAGAAGRGLPQRAAVIAVATAIADSGLHNHPGTHPGADDGDRGADRDERGGLGVFARRPSPQWGTPARVLNPAAATDSFYTALVTLPGWDSLRPGAAAAAIQSDRAPNQGPAGPERYAAQEDAAAALVDRFWTGPDLPTVTGPPGAPGLPDGGRAGLLVPPACPDASGSDIAARGPLDRAGLEADFRLPADPVRRAAVVFALAQVGRPYVFGAKGPGAFDCSGLAQAAWAAAGVGISAGTLSQIHDGAPVVTLADTAPGDLLFSAGSLGTASRPRHVGLYAGGGFVVEAHSATTGVIVSPLQAWTTKTVAIRRITAGRAGEGGAAGGGGAVGQDGGAVDRSPRAALADAGAGR